MKPLIEYIIANSERGACQCGRCLLDSSSPEPKGHTADMIFFKVSAKPTAKVDKLRVLVKAHVGCHNECDLFDGKEHNYMELGGWIGDQGFALALMGLGSLLGLWSLLTPRGILGANTPGDLVMKMAGAGYIAIQARKSP